MVKPLAAHRDHVPTNDEEDLKDECGNYIGPAVPDEDDDEDEDEGDDYLEAAYTAR